MKAIVLLRKNYKEYDQIIKFYTLEKGKLEVLARGIKKIVSKNSSALEPGCFVEAEIIKGREIENLGSVQILKFYKNTRIDLEKIIAIKFILGLFDKTIQVGEKDEKLFYLLNDFLDYLDKYIFKNNKNLEIIFAIDVFVANFLRILGFGNKNELEELFFKDIKNKNFNKKLHKEIYNNLIYNLDLKIKDWQTIYNI